MIVAAIDRKMSNDPDTFELEIFWRLVASGISLQKQHEQSNEDDKCLRDQLMTAVGIPAIQVSLADHIPRTAQLAANRIANRQFNIRKTAGFSLVHFAQSEKPQNSNQSLYNLGHTGEQKDSELSHMEIMDQVRVDGKVADRQKVIDKNEYVSSECAE